MLCEQLGNWATEQLSSRTLVATADDDGWTELVAAIEADNEDDQTMHFMKNGVSFMFIN